MKPETPRIKGIWAVLGGNALMVLAVIALIFFGDKIVASSSQLVPSVKEYEAEKRAVAAERAKQPQAEQDPGEYLRHEAIGVFLKAAWDGVLEGYHGSVDGFLKYKGVQGEKGGEAATSDRGAGQSQPGMPPGFSNGSNGYMTAPPITLPNSKPSEIDPSATPPKEKEFPKLKSTPTPIPQDKINLYYPPAPTPTPSPTATPKKA